MFPSGTMIRRTGHGSMSGGWQSGLAAKAQLGDINSSEPYYGTGCWRVD